MTGESPWQSGFACRGIKEKVLAARRAGFSRVVLPRENEKNLRDLPEHVQREMEFVFVESVAEVLAAVFRNPRVATEFRPRTCLRIRRGRVPDAAGIDANRDGCGYKARDRTLVYLHDAEVSFKHEKELIPLRIALRCGNNTQRMIKVCSCSAMQNGVVREFEGSRLFRLARIPVASSEHAPRKPSGRSEQDGFAIRLSNGWKAEGINVE